MRTHTDAELSRTGWTDEETRALAHTYIQMLRLESDGLLGRSKGQTTKISLVRTFLQQHSPSRTKGSVEAKLMNLSAVRDELGLPRVQGYAPLSNMSDSCRKIGAEVFAQESSNEMGAGVSSSDDGSQSEEVLANQDPDSIREDNHRRIMALYNEPGTAALGQALRLASITYDYDGDQSVWEKNRQVIDSERHRRQKMWSDLCSLSPNGDGKELSAKDVQELRAYYGGRGMWRDKEFTGSMTTDGHGITIGVQHTGSTYADELNESGGFYYYPKTEQPTHDRGDVEATKNCKRLRMPLFVVTRPTPSSAIRNVNLGWVVHWDDEAGWFVIETDHVEQPISPVDEDIDSKPFDIKDTTGSGKKKGLVDQRPNQRAFKAATFARYGSRCCVSGLSAPQMLDAAHIVPKRKKGVDDPRNGLVLSASHHRAYDAHLWAIDPGDLSIVTRPGGPTREELMISVEDIRHLSKPPAKEALEWAWHEKMKVWKV